MMKIFPCCRANRNVRKSIYLGFICFVCFQILEQMLEAPLSANYIRSDSELEVASFPNESKALPFEKKFKYPLDVDMPQLVKEYKDKNGVVDVKPINTFPYEFMNEMPDKCKSNEKINLIIIVKSRIMNFRRRFAIRETWGNEEALKEHKLKVVFLLGNPFDIPTKMLIKHEIRQNNDIIQIDYVDSYYNNTIKTTGAIHWATKHCSNARFMMIADDDFYIATDYLIQKLNAFPEDVYNKLFMGKAWFFEIPQRGAEQKWFIPVSVWPYVKYPPFVSAGATIMSMKVAIDVNIAIKFTKRFKFDDVYLAIVISKLGIIPTHNNYIFISKKAKIEDEGFHDVLASHKYGDPDEIRKAWNYHRQYVENQTLANGHV